MGLRKEYPIQNELAAKIMERLKWDKRVSPADFDVVVRGSAVIISGFVDTSFKRQAALELVSDIEGVWSIEDRIVVPAEYYRTDDELKKILNRELDEMIKIGGEHIELDVIDGVVKLQGEVFRPRLKALAVGLAWELSGVRDVVNDIQIIEPPHRVPLSMDFKVITESTLSYREALDG
ncbi:MAG: BON domain-containing protein [Bacillota bacterium]